MRDTALVRMPIWLFGLTVGRVLKKKDASTEDYEEIEEEEEEELHETDSSSGAGGKRTPSTGSVDDDFELLDKSVEDIASSTAAKATGSQAQAGGKNSKRKNKGKKR